MRIKVQKGVDTNAMAAGQRRLDRAKAETFAAMKELKERRAASGVRKRFGRTGAIHYDALVHAMDEQGKDVITPAGKDYWDFEKRKNPWMCEDGCVPGTDSVNGHVNRFGKVRERFMRGKWWHWDDKTGDWVEGAVSKGKGFLGQ